MRAMRLWTILCCCVLAGGLTGGCAPFSTSQTTGPELEGVAEEPDFGCSYFYFLWGRHAELGLKFAEALEAYEKGLICDPEAVYIERKIPILLLRMGRNQEAVDRLQDFLQRHPGDSGTRMLLARVLIRLGRLDEAADQYRKIHIRDPGETDSLLMLARLYIDQEKMRQARVALKEVLQIDPASYAARILLARIDVQEEKFDQAIGEYGKALELNWSVDLALEMSEVFLRQKRYGEAVELYQKILRDDPENERVRIALVHVYLLQNREQEALRELNRLKTVSSRPDRVDLTIARLFARQKKFDRAATILRQVLEKNDLSEGRFLLALIYFQEKKYQEALGQLRHIDRQAPEYEDAVFLQVRIYRALKQVEQAIEILEEAVQEETGRSSEMFVLLAALYRTQNREDKGRDVFSRALQAFPDDENLLYEYGLFLEHSGEHDKALSVMQQVIRVQPRHAGALNYVGYTWADQKVHLDKALEYIEKAVSLEPENGYIRDSLGWVYYRLGRLEEARKALEEAVKLSPDDPAILDHLGDVYLELDMVQEAVEVYRRALDLFEDRQDIERVRNKLQMLREQGRE
ncbi:tetratricopeptide repeat protein [Desulfolithobacter sp.]